MAPSILSNSPILLAEVVDKNNNSFEAPLQRTIRKRKPYFQTEIVWKNVMLMTALHLSAFYGIYLLLTRQSNILTFILSYTYGIFGGMGITCGAHRLWSHRSYKANWKLRFILAVANLIAFQNSIFVWVRDHRVHHKFTDTDADPHNSKRGLFFSHIGWLLVRKHQDVKRKGATIDMSDLESDPIVMFQKKYYGYLMPTFCFIIPTLFPIYLLNESIWNSWFVAAALRYVLTLHATWLVNSAAHKWGAKPMDRTIPPSDNALVALAAFGEGWHNYHHVFPWDYKTSELGFYSMNLSTAFIDFFAKLGWAYDMKTVSNEMIEKRAARTGDGSRPSQQLTNEKQHFEQNSKHVEQMSKILIWGWNDVDLNEDDKKCVTIINRT